MIGTIVRCNCACQWVNVSDGYTLTECPTCGGIRPVVVQGRPEFVMPEEPCKEPEAEPPCRPYRMTDRLRQTARPVVRKDVRRQRTCSSPKGAKR